MTGQVLYDGLGGVLSSTLPFPPTSETGGTADVATGLVHMGDGRWLDPALGRPLQPNPNGGPPTVPQALNRFAAAPLGQPGVADAAIPDSFNWTPHRVGFAKNTAVEAARVLPVVKGYTYTGIRRVAVRGSYETLSQGLPEALQRFPGRLVGNDLDGSLFYLTKIQVEAQSALGIGVAARNTARELTNVLPEGFLVQVRGGLDGYVSAQPMTGQLDEVVRLNGIGFGFDFVIGIGFQYAQDYRNPYLTEGQVIGRSVVSGLGGAGFSYGAVLFVCGATAGIPCAILAGVGGGIVWSVAGQPLVFQWLGIEPAGRNLNPVNIRRRSSFDPRGKFSRI